MKTTMTRAARIFTVLLLLLATTVSVSATLVTDKGAPYYTTLTEATAAAKKAGVPTVIKFYTDWCIWCKVMDTAVFEKPEAKAAFGKDYILTRINAEVDTAVATKYAVTGYPTLVLLDKDGVEIDRIIGYLPETEFFNTLTDYQNGIGTLGDLLNKSKTDTTRDLMFQIADKYKYSGHGPDATQWYQKVISAGAPTDSMSAASRVALADLLRRAKKYDEALAAYASIMIDFKGKPPAENAGEMRAIVFAKKGDTANAITAWGSFLKDFPASEDTSYAREQIEKLKNPPKVEKK
jgi:thioredoxin-related protein